MEIDSLLTLDAHSEGAELNILDPITGEPTDGFIMLMGGDSREWQRAMKRQRKAAVKLLEEKRPITEDDEIAAEIEQLVAITIGWRGFESGKKEYKFSEEACRNFYTSSPPVRAQVERFVTRRVNFIKG